VVFQNQDLSFAVTVVTTAWSWVAFLNTTDVPRRMWKISATMKLAASARRSPAPLGKVALQNEDGQEAWEHRHVLRVELAIRVKCPWTSMGGRMR
jgi:cytochrome oxidase assembly protein ShyY1